MTHAGGDRAVRAPWPGGSAWIGGEYCPVEEAKISVLDLGVTRSDATYDVVHVWRGRFYRLEDHLDRFAASCARLRLDPGYDRAGITDILHGCVRATGLREAYVSMTCTRGRLAGGSRDLRTARCTSAPAAARVSAAQYHPYVASSTTFGCCPARAIARRSAAGLLVMCAVSSFLPSDVIRTSTLRRRCRSIPTTCRPS
jgi:branched-subunit amino acid aminotransferase/4-amino-4-deoxychorismate lyase